MTEETKVSRIKLSNAAIAGLDAMLRAGVRGADMVKTPPDEEEMIWVGVEVLEVVGRLVVTQAGLTKVQETQRRYVKMAATAVEALDSKLQDALAALEGMVRQHSIDGGVSGRYDTVAISANADAFFALERAGLFKVYSGGVGRRWFGDFVEKKAESPTEEELEKVAVESAAAEKERADLEG